ncbi:O-antigen ligase family protein [Luteococcus peritonei]|uniref:O-antigen ligase family protein n=1 Tax=Luteococcus peritonei TaxID=88874 RepID=A0ABW4RT33_9ACTN
MAETAPERLLHSGRTVVEWTLFCFLVFLPLNATLLQMPAVSLGKMGFTALLLLVLALECAHGLPSRLPRSLPGPGLLGALVAYCTVVGLSTVANGHPVADLLQYLVMPMGVLALYCCEQRTPGSFFHAVFLASATHLCIAVVLDNREVGTAGVARLTGGSHPITLGLEAALVGLFFLAQVLARRGWPNLVLLVLCLYVMVESLSKTAILGSLVAVGLQFVFFNRRHLLERAMVTISLAVVGAALLLQSLLEHLLGTTSTDSLVNGTGRTTIWATILAHLGDYAAYGYGYPPLHEPGLRDDELLRLTGGLPSENAFLAALLMGGLLAGLLYVVIFVSACRAAVRVTAATHGYSLAAVVVLFTSALFNESASGLNYLWFWLLALFSLTNAARRRAPRRARRGRQRVVRRPAAPPAATIPSHPAARRALTRGPRWN